MPGIITLEQQLADAGRERSQQVAQRSARPSQRRDSADPRQAHRSPDRAAAAAAAPMRAQMRVERAAGGSTPGVRLVGYATTYEQTYVMYDMFGPYTEVVSAGAGADSLAASPDVKFFYNHRGAPMARTVGAEQHPLVLSEDDHGLLSDATPNMRLDVAVRTVELVESGLVDEMSFAFIIDRGAWSPDWTEYRIITYDIDRGDTSAVGYGANPTTEIGAERAAAPASAQAGRTLSPTERQLARRIAYGGR
jgi:HK97 family phage prohead protease